MVSGETLAYIGGGIGIAGLVVLSGLNEILSLYDSSRGEGKPNHEKPRTSESELEGSVTQTIPDGLLDK